MQYRVAEEEEEEGDIEEEVEGKGEVEEDSKAGEVTAANRVLHIRGIKVVKEGNTTLRTIITNKMAREDPIPRTMDRLPEVLGIRTT